MYFVFSTCFSNTFLKPHFKLSGLGPSLIEIKMGVTGLLFKIRGAKL